MTKLENKFVAFDTALKRNLSKYYHKVLWYSNEY